MLNVNLCAFHSKEFSVVCRDRVAEYHVPSVRHGLYLSVCRRSEEEFHFYICFVLFVGCEHPVLKSSQGVV